MKVLFIGNSHTFVHYVPFRVAAYFEKEGQHLDAIMLTHPGVGLDFHLQQSSTYFDLLYGNFDAVVLQHNAHPFPGKQSLLEAGRKIAELIPQKTKTYLYMTWSEKNNPAGQEIMSQAYEELAEAIGATVCPVGKIWWQIRENYPDELYFADGEHASIFGASLAAVVIGSTLLDKKLDLQQIYSYAKEIAELSPDQRLIDICYEDGQYAMKPIKDL